MACKVDVLAVKNASLLSVANDSMFCAVEHVSGLSAASVSCTNFFGSRPVVSTDGRCEILQVPLYGATEPLRFACFSEFKI